MSDKEPLLLCSCLQVHANGLLAIEQSVYTSVCHLQSSYQLQMHQAETGYAADIDCTQQTQQSQQSEQRLYRHNSRDRKHRQLRRVWCIIRHVYVGSHAEEYSCPDHQLGLHTA
jgi:hypothetical protein